MTSLVTLLAVVGSVRVAYVLMRFIVWLDEN